MHCFLCCALHTLDQIFINLVYSASSLLMTPDTPPHHKGPQALGKWQLASAYPETFAEWSQAQQQCQI